MGGKERGVQTMKISRKNIYRLNLTDFELRVMVNALNSSRLKMKAEGDDPTDVSDIILKCLDALEGRFGAGG